MRNCDPVLIVARGAPVWRGIEAIWAAGRQILPLPPLTGTPVSSRFFTEINDNEFPPWLMGAFDSSSLRRNVEECVRGAPRKRCTPSPFENDLLKRSLHKV
ncbi:hypothetical protein AAFF_G00106960 [Aldrovandia affinis]|uniref:Uncharacterized protein n=1 Tax=Aldrovandia affinis TaxID=143900 RepID=A0AAD7WYR3_9TELE|nr:hypothetical protein AAFF_G00106960 [Aldrovandia affinis]